MYGPFVIAYLFLGGTAAGSFFVMAAWSLSFNSASRRANHSLRFARAFESLQERVYVISLLSLALAVMSLFWDLEHPERMLLVILHPHATAITFGAFCLIAELLLGGLLTAGTALSIPSVSGRLKRVIELLCCIVSIGTMAYTGVFLATNPAVAFWDTWSLVAVFVFSSFSCGLTLVLLVDYFIKDQTLLLRAVRPLQKCHLLCLAAEAVSIALFVFSVSNNPDAARSFSLLLSPEMLATAVVGVFGFGIVAPAALEAYSLAKKECRTIPVSDVLCLFGGLCLRFCVIACGVNWQ